MYAFVQQIPWLVPFLTCQLSVLHANTYMGEFCDFLKNTAYFFPVHCGRSLGANGHSRGAAKATFLQVLGVQGACGTRVQSDVSILLRGTLIRGWGGAVLPLFTRWGAHHYVLAFRGLWFGGCGAGWGVALDHWARGQGVSLCLRVLLHVTAVYYGHCLLWGHSLLRRLTEGVRGHLRWVETDEVQILIGLSGLL